jgi:hypothetical protein
MKMKPMTVSNYIYLTDPKLLDLAYRCRDILRVLKPCYFDRASTIAKMANLPEQVTRQLLLELVEAGLVYIDEDSDPNGYLLYGTWPTDEDISRNWSTQRATIIPASAFG